MSGEGPPRARHARKPRGRGREGGVRAVPAPRRTGLTVGAAIGSGIAAITAERGGADFLLAVNAGRMRNRGAPSIASMLPCHDPRAVTEEFLAQEVLPIVSIPVLLGIDCWEARCETDDIVARVRDLGAAGAVNFPNATLMSAGMRTLLGRAGRGFAREVEILKAVQEAGLTSLYYCSTREQARHAAEAGLEMILLNFGWNVGGTAGHGQRASLEEVGIVVRDYARMIRSINPKARILLEGGPIITADDLGYVAQFSSIDGYVGGSTLDRLPYEESVMNRIAGYRNAGEAQVQLDARQNRVLAWGWRHGFAGRSRPLLRYLERLRALAGGTHPLALLHERGADLGPSLHALAGVRKGTPLRGVVHVDAATADYPGQVAQLLFGRGGEAALLADAKVALLVLHETQTMLPSVQRRLARSLRDGMVALQPGRRQVPVAPRCVFCFARPEQAEGLPDDLAEALTADLSGWSAVIPPLRERAQDLPDLIERQRNAAGLAAPARPPLSPAALQGLRRHAWPGNDQELEEVVGQLASAGADGDITHEDVERLLPAGAYEPRPALKEMERSRIVDALWRNGFHKGRTAAALNISRKTLYNRMRRHGLLD